jgi:hypothetical protein
MRTPRGDRPMVIGTASAPSAGGFGAHEIGSDYLATETHYLSVAGRILSALRESAKMVLVTGDQPPDVQLLSQALRKSAEADFIVIPISGGSEAILDQLRGADIVVAALGAGGGTTLVPETPEAGPPLFLLGELDAVAAPQIEKICDAARRGPRSGAAMVLLARTSFVKRLEEPSLQSLKELIAVRLSFEEIGQDEGIEFLRHQLALRHQRTEPGGNPAGMLRRVLFVIGALLAAGVIGLYVLQKTGPVGEPSVYSVNVAPAPPPATVLEPAKPATGPVPETPVMPSPAAAPLNPSLPDPTHQALRSQPAPPPAEKPAAETPSPSSSAPPSRLATVQPLPQAEIAALVTRGDDFLKSGDVASARLFYERAADAGDGPAALRLGATFDPGVLARAGIRGIPGDPAQASLWYRRARDLGEAAAAERLKSLEQQPPTERGSSGH